MSSVSVNCARQHGQPLSMHCSRSSIAAIQAVGTQVWLHGNLEKCGTYAELEMGNTRHDTPKRKH
eukprot:870320-Amphidinium_carterae.2